MVPDLSGEQIFKWYVAELVIVFHFHSAQENLVHINTILIEAESAEVSFAKAIKFGEAENRTFVNSDAEDIEVTFRGLRGLYLVNDRLEDGAEILWEEREKATEHEIKEMLRPKEELGVFRSNTGTIR